jgi:hypothetical protein
VTPPFDNLRNVLTKVREGRFMKSQEIREIVNKMGGREKTNGERK